MCQGCSIVIPRSTLQLASPTSFPLTTHLAYEFGFQRCGTESEPPKLWISQHRPKSLIEPTRGLSKPGGGLFGPFFSLFFLP